MLFRTIPAVFLVRDVYAGFGSHALCGQAGCKLLNKLHDRRSIALVVGSTKGASVASGFT